MSLFLTMMPACRTDEPRGMLLALRLTVSDEGVRAYDVLLGNDRGGEWRRLLSTDAAVLEGKLAPDGNGCLVLAETGDALRRLEVVSLDGTRRRQVASGRILACGWIEQGRSIVCLLDSIPGPVFRVISSLDGAPRTTHTTNTDCKDCVSSGLDDVVVLLGGDAESDPGRAMVNHRTRYFHIARVKEDTLSVGDRIPFGPDILDVHPSFGLLAFDWEEGRSSWLIRALPQGLVVDTLVSGLPGYPGAASGFWGAEEGEVFYYTEAGHFRRTIHGSSEEVPGLERDDILLDWAPLPRGENR